VVGLMKKCPAVARAREPYKKCVKLVIRGSRYEFPVFYDIVGENQQGRFSLQTS
jgi:hypothetical protein